MAYTGKKPGNVNTDFLEAGGELANHDEVTVDASGNITSPLSLTNTTTGDSLTITTTEDSSTAAPVICLKRNSSSPDDGDYLGQIKFQGENDADQQVLYAKITGKTSDVTDTTEDGLLEFAVKKNGSNSINARLTHAALKLINGTALEVDGTVTATSYIGDGSALTGISGGKVLQVVSARDTTQTSINSSGTYTDIGLSAAITPSATSSSVLVIFTITAKVHPGESYRIRLLRDSTVVHTDTANVVGFGGSNYIFMKTPHQFFDTSISTTSSVTYKVQAITPGGEVDFQDNGADSEITLIEIGA